VSRCGRQKDRRLLDRVIAIDTRRHVELLSQSGPRSILRRSSCTANNCQRRDSLMSSRSMMIGTPDTIEV
jgi:hypothetical protein